MAVAELSASFNQWAQRVHKLAKSSVVEALVATTVTTWNKSTWEELMHEIPALRMFSDQLLSRSFEAGQRHIFSLISSPAEAKYL